MKTDWDKISILYRAPSIYISYQVSVHLAKQFQSETWKVLYEDCSFRPIPSTNMAAKGNSCFWLANVKKKFYHVLFLVTVAMFVGRMKPNEEVL
jgi:hypothetical protein